MQSHDPTLDGRPGPDPDPLLYRRFGGAAPALEPEEVPRREPIPAANVPRPAAEGDLARLTAETAHDFNNILSVVLACASEIETASSDGGARERAEEIRIAAERGTQLTRQLIEAARPGGEGNGPVEVNRAVNSAARLLVRTLGPGVRFSIAPASGLPRVTVGREQIEQMLLNLATNARDAMGESGNFMIRTGMVTVGPTEGRLGSGWYVCIQVSDSGPGMEADVLERALEPYFTTKSRANGSGLGLPTVAGIARAAGGEVRIQSAPGEGTSVSIYLPAVRANGDPLTLGGDERAIAEPA